MVGARWQARVMAGGMNKRGGHSYGTKAERIAATRGERPALACHVVISCRRC
jgi:hypothetical protein